MGEAKPEALHCSFNASVRVEGRGDRLSSEGGVLALRELDERLGLTRWLAEHLDDPRRPDLITHPLVELLRARTYLMAQGQRDQDDADRLRDDPACRLAVSQRRGLSPLEPSDDESLPDGLASQPTQSRLVQALSTEENLKTLNRGLFESARRDILAHRGRRFQNVTLDIDSLPIEVHGEQAGSAYNGHYKVRCYHPIVAMLSETGHWLRAELRPGNVHTADGAADFLLPLIDEVEENIARVARARGDAGFPDEKLLIPLEARNIGYAFRLKTNAVMERLAKPYLHRPPGRPPREPREWFHELLYKAEPWTQARRLVLVVLERPGELFVDHFFLLSNWSEDQLGGKDLLEFYRERGTMESHLGELQSVLAPALSCTSRPKSHVGGQPPAKRTTPRDGERANEATFLLYALAYNLANSARRVLNREAPGKDGGGWSLRRLRDAVLRVAVRLTVSARRATIVMNEGSARIWNLLWAGIARLRPVLQT